MDRIRKYSRILKILFFIAAGALPLINAGFWVTGGYSFMEWNLIPDFPGMLVKPLAELAPIAKFFSFLVSMIPTAINGLALLSMARLFHHFEKLEIFCEASVKCIRKAGICLVLNQLTYPFYLALMSLALSYTNSPGQRFISVGFHLEQFSLLVIGLTVLLISYVMQEGTRLQEEQSATI